MSGFAFSERYINTRIKELEAQIKELQAEISELDKAGMVFPLLGQLRHHHASQAKPHTTPCSKSYNESLAQGIENLFTVIKPKDSK